MTDQAIADIVMRLRTFEPDEPCLADQIKMEDAAKEIELLRAALTEICRSPIEARSVNIARAALYHER